MAQRIEIDSPSFKEAQIAPFTILRVACLPADVLPAFVRPELSRGLAAYVRLRKQLQETGNQLVDALELLVPQAESNEFRTRLIRLKRDIHNNRSFVLDEDIGAWLDEKAVRTLTNRWQELHGQTGEVLKCLTEEAEKAPQLIDDVLTECWGNPIFRQGVSVGSPSLSTRVTPDWRSFKTKKRKGISKSLFAYVTRAAAKTSPFSTLTSNCILPLNTFGGESRLAGEKPEIWAKAC